MIKVVHLGFFYLLTDLLMQNTHQCFDDACFPPLLVVPKDRRVGWTVFGQVFPIAPILELIEDSINDLSFCPIARSGSFLLWEYLD
jgi:hypothetical protein